MRNCDPIIVKHVNCVGRRAIAVLALLFVRPAIRLDAGDEYAADLEFSGAVNNMRYALDCVRIVMAGRVVAYRDNIRPEPERVVAHGFVIEWIRHHSRVVALGQTKAGMSVPGNFHETVASDGYYTRCFVEALIKYQLFHSPDHPQISSVLFWCSRRLQDRNIFHNTSNSRCQSSCLQRRSPIGNDLFLLLPNLTDHYPSASPDTSQQIQRNPPDD